jgi:prepilin-type N-terminal cleavage/methylation domain-containing protein
MKKNQAGFTLIEMMLTMGLTLIIMGSTMAAMSNAIRASEVASLTTNMNQGLRTAMDIMVRDMLQVGQGLPSGRTIDIPNNGSTAIASPVKLPGAPFATEVVRYVPTAATAMTAILPGTGLGPTINGVATDVITMVQADGAFLSTISDYDVNLTALTATTMTVDPSVDITNGGADDLKPGDLIMLMKATSTALVQITAVTDQTATFASGDSLSLNQTAAPKGTLTAHLAKAPADVCSTTIPVLIRVSFPPRRRASAWCRTTSTTSRTPSGRGWSAASTTATARPARRPTTTSRGPRSRSMSRISKSVTTWWTVSGTPRGQVRRGRSGGRRRLRGQRVFPEPDPQDQRDHLGPLPHADAADTPVPPEHADDPGQPAQHVVHGSLPVKKPRKLKDGIPVMSRIATQWRRIRTKVEQDRGIALMLVLMIMMLLSALMIGFMTSIMADTRSGGVDRDETQAYAVAHAGMEKLTSDLASLFLTDYSPNGTQISAKAAVAPSIAGFTYTDPDGTTGYKVQFTARNGTGACPANCFTVSTPTTHIPVPDKPDTGTTIAAGPYQGSRGWSRTTTSW